MSATINYPQLIETATSMLGNPNLIEPEEQITLMLTTIYNLDKTQVDAIMQTAKVNSAKSKQAQPVPAQIAQPVQPVQIVQPAPSPVASMSERDGEALFVDPMPAFPAALKKLRRWVRWRLEAGTNGKPTKVPYQVSGHKASSTEPTTWSNYQEVVAGQTINDNGGVGFVVNGDGYTGIDLDGCRNKETGDLTDWAEQIIDALGDSYTETTPSETGVRVWVRGVIPENDKVFNLNPSCGYGDKVKIEVFETERYFTVTGETIFDGPAVIEEADMAKAYRLFHEIKATYPPAPKSQKEVSVDANTNDGTQVEWSGLFRCSKFDIFTDGQIESREPFVISNRIGKLTYASQSEADLAFCTMLALHHDNDVQKIDAGMRESQLYRVKWGERLDYRENTIKKAIETAVKIRARSAVPVLTIPEGTPAMVFEDTSKQIPPFDSSVVNGIYKRFVDVATKNTTLTPQFVYAVTKTIVGAKMAGKVRFENLDVEPRFYAALIGETGSGKGEAWRRVFQILESAGYTDSYAGVKVLFGADSGEGIRDAFFAKPEEAPVLLYIDEVESVGNKGASTRQPGIIDKLIELADTTQVGRTKAQKKNDIFSGSKQKNDARLCVVMCGQEGAVYMKAFAGRTKLGFWDRLYPEYGERVEAGMLPRIDRTEALQLISELNSLDYSGELTMSYDARGFLEQFWDNQPKEVRKMARWKKNLWLDAYMSAFGRRSRIAEQEDVEIAAKIFTRQLRIRQVHFTSEVPDRTGYYLGRIKEITESMRSQLKAGRLPAQVALSRREYERKTNAARDNEEHLFDKAWQIHSRVHLCPFNVQKSNGQVYAKFLPIAEEE